MSTQPETKAISLEVELPHPPAKVWRALTEPELLKQWLMANDLRPVVGHQFRFKSAPTQWWDGIVNCEVLELELHKRLRYSWRSGPGPSGLDTEVTWTLVPTPSGGTRLVLEHSGFRPTDAFASDGAGKGWKRMLNEALPAVLAELS
jgi:uncharacterized protein YndB with AHSA1/START domain